ncbi:DNA-directed RNA polymerase subunit omega [Nephila pilipes]|uniref:DNA-directed RNA polymerase n=1 Tax=Nephila pilipes TaxID=299642 RepID=A0A8X6Q1J8_NEPPI|nr:DNA-directed RNA polymerase subunit omega [Nephila pilipes]
MAESIVEKCTEQVSNRFKLVLLASQRTHDLNTGASNPVQTVQFKDHKNTIVSLYEIAEKQVDTHELFNLLVDLDASQESQDYEVDGEIDDEINDQDGDEEVSV